MNFELILEISGLVIVIMTNFALMTIFFSKLDSRIKHCESEVSTLKATDTLIIDEIKTLHKIEGQLELIIAHFVNK